MRTPQKNKAAQVAQDIQTSKSAPVKMTKRGKPKTKASNVSNKNKSPATEQSNNTTTTTTTTAEHRNNPETSSNISNSRRSKRLDINYNKGLKESSSQPIPAADNETQVAVDHEEEVEVEDSLDGSLDFGNDDENEEHPLQANEEGVAPSEISAKEAPQTEPKARLIDNVPNWAKAKNGYAVPWEDDQENNTNQENSSRRTSNAATSEDNNPANHNKTTRLASARNRKRAISHDDDYSDTENIVTRRHSSVERPFRKLTSHRKNLWSDQELAALAAGIKEYGTSWAEILYDNIKYGDKSLINRTNVNLKDKARNEKARRTRVGEDLGVFNLPDILPEPLAQSKCTWTDQELAALSIGIKAHGMSWADILYDNIKHGDKSLINRTNVDLKDKARNEKARRMRSGEDLGVFDLKLNVDYLLPPHLREFE